MRTSLLVPVLALSLMAPAALAQSGPNPYLAQAKVFYQGLEFEKCIARLQQAQGWKSTPQEAVEIELYSGLCKYNLGKANEAEDHFQLAVRLNPKAALPPYTSPKIEALFEKVRQSVPTPAPAETAVAEVKPVPAPSDAPKKTDLVPEQKPEAPVEAELRASSERGGPSIGVPLALGGLAVASAGFGAFMGVQAKDLEAQANDADGAGRFESDAIRLGEQARQRAVLANVGFGVAAIAASSAIVTFLLSGDDGEAEATGSGGGIRF